MDVNEPKPYQDLVEMFLRVRRVRLPREFRRFTGDHKSKARVPSALIESSSSTNRGDEETLGAKPTPQGTGRVDHLINKIRENLPREVRR